MTSTRDIVRSGVKVGVVTAASLLGWVVAGKVLALYLGAAGVGVFGLMRQLLQNLTVVATFSGQNALVQGIALLDERDEQVRFGASVLLIQVLLGLAVGVSVFVAAPWVAARLLPHPDATSLLRWLVVPLLAVVLQTWAIGVLNGHRLLDALVRSQSTAPVAVVLLVMPMIWLIREGRPAAYAVMLAGPAAVSATWALWEARRSRLLPEPLGWQIRRTDGARFFKVSAVLMASAAMTSGTQFIQSWAVATYRGLGQAGVYWTAWTLSMTYVTLVLGSYGTYYLPNLSRLRAADERRELVHRYLGLALVAMPLLVTAVVVFKPWAVRLVFSEDLLPALRVMRWMLLGDLLKGVSWVLALPMIALGHMRWFFWSEALFTAGIASAAVAMMVLGGSVEALGVLFLVAYALYLPAMVLYARLRLEFRWTGGEVARLVAGLALVGTASALTWSDEVVRPGAVAVSVGLAAVFAIATLGPHLRQAAMRLLGRS